MTDARRRALLRGLLADDEAWVDAVDFHGNADPACEPLTHGELRALLATATIDAEPADEAEEAAVPDTNRDVVAEPPVSHDIPRVRGAGE
jgi:hypothetical protein